MHNNYYFLRQLSQELAEQITGFTLVSCFSQNKDELILEFNNASVSFFIKASLQPDFQCLSFPASFHRAKKNSVDLFQSAVMNKVIRIRQFTNERSFAILLENENTLVFSMHAARANVIWFTGDVVQEIFRNNFQADLELNLTQLDRSIDWSYETFEKNQASLSALYFTFGKPVWNHLSELQFDASDAKVRWNLLAMARAYLEKPAYYILNHDGIISFSLFQSGHVEQTFARPMEAVNEFFLRRTSTFAFQKEKASLLSHVSGKLKQSLSFLEKSREKFAELEHDLHYQQWADLVMANLNHITIGQEKVVVENFYDDQRPVEIKLKKELSPQKNAEVFYRKAKNQVIETKTLQTSIIKKEKEIEALNEWKLAIEEATERTVLSVISESILKQAPDKQIKKSLPYHEFEFKGYRIWVGKNASANDEPTQKFSYKEDLWLHAKDVAGSHVLIKHQAGKPFPKDVIEHAAGLAAGYSKRKNESLCPVVFTPKKFVRKRKGDPAGMVVVEREEVILVEPRK